MNLENININNKNIDNALYQAIILSFYEKGLLTNDEIMCIRKDLRKRGISLDNITLKSDVCNKEVER